MLSDFSNDGKALVAGEIVGMRAFKVRRDGTLMGPHTKYEWTPGENVAQCRLLGPYCLGICHKHCGCGFYGYFYNQENSYHGVLSGTVQAIIRATGTATVGTRGFRAERAEIVGLVAPTNETYDHARRAEELFGSPSFVPPQPKGLRKFWYRKLLPWAYEHDLWPWAAFLIGLFSLCFIGPFLWWWLGVTAGATTMAGGLLLAILSACVGVQSMDMAWMKFDPPSQMWQNDLTAHHVGNVLLPEVWEKVKQQYPTVPVFRTLEEAKAAIPMTFYPKGTEMYGITAKYTEGR
jgi:hypothetical protein